VARYKITWRERALIRAGIQEPSLRERLRTQELMPDVRLHGRMRRRRFVQEIKEPSLRERLRTQDLMPNDAPGRLKREWLKIRMTARNKRRGGSDWMTSSP
jgi:hypothetical protein